MPELNAQPEKDWKVREVRDADLRGSDLSGVDLRGCELSGAQFDVAVLRALRAGRCESCLRMSSAIGRAEELPESRGTLRAAGPDGWQVRAPKRGHPGGQA
jgi:hypothetical protein